MKISKNRDFDEFWAPKMALRRVRVQFSKKFRGVLKCFKMAHNWFLRSSNTFLDQPRTKFWISHPKVKILVSSLRRLIFHENQRKSRFWAVLSYFSRNCMENENVRKNAQKVLRLHFWHRKSILRTKVDLETSWYALKRLISASTKKLPTHFFSLTWLLSQTVAVWFVRTRTK